MPFILILIPFKIIFFILNLLTIHIFELIYFIISFLIKSIYNLFDKRIYTKFYIENDKKSFYYETKISLLTNKILLPEEAYRYIYRSFRKDLKNCFPKYGLNEELICPKIFDINMSIDKKLFFVLNGKEYYLDKNDIFFEENGLYKLIFGISEDNMIEIGLEFFRKYPIEINLKKYQFTIYSNNETNSQFNSNNNIDNL